MKKIGITLFIFFLTLSAFSQTSIPRAQAMFIYNFCRLIEWPSAYRSGPFVIGIIGNSPTHAEINNFISGKRVGTQTVVIKRFTSPGQIEKCHVLFVPFDQTKNLSAINSKIGGNSTLIIGEKSDAINNGATISFAIVADKLKFEIKPTNASTKNISISGKLTQMAYKVY